MTKVMTKVLVLFEPNGLQETVPSPVVGLINDAGSLSTLVIFVALNNQFPLHFNMPIYA
jgi:hypothetical protein